jgi:MFS family permease
VSAVAPLIANLLLSLVCRQCHDSADLDFESPQCQQPDILGRLSSLYTLSLLFGGVIGLCVTPRLALYSDRAGRMKAFLIVQGSMTLGLSTNILAYHLWRYVDYHWLLVGVVFEGLSNPTAIFTLLSAYISDSTRPDARTRALGWAFAVTSVGTVFGPILSGALISATGSLIVPYYFVVGLTGLSTLATYWILPESINPETMHRAQTDSLKNNLKAANNGLLNNALSTVNILRPINDLYMLCSECRYDKINMMALVLVDCMYIVLGLGLGQVSILYLVAKYQFTPLDLTYLFTAVGIIQAVCLVGLVPLISWVINQYESNCKGVRLGEIYIIRACNVVEVISLLACGFADSKPMAAAAICLRSLGVLARPTIGSATLNILPSDRVGRFMGARGVLETIIGYGSATIFMALFTATQAHHTETVYGVASLLYTVATGASMILRKTDMEQKEEFE